MAVVLDALAPHVKKMMADMVKEKMAMLLGVSGEIRKLEGNLEHLQNFLTDAERRRITDVRVQAWVGKLKDAMYEAADIVDLCQLEAMEREEEEEHTGWLCSLERVLLRYHCLEPFLFFVHNPGFAYQAASRIKNLNNELVTIREGAVDFSFNINISSYAVARQTSLAYVPKREVAQFVESDVVGEQIEKNTAFLLQRLVADEGGSQDAATIKVVAIVGLGGIGKSTLAKKILASEAVEEYKKIWLSVTQLVSRVDLLRTAITSAGGKHGGEKDEALLVEALTDALSKKKFLLVLDDVWNADQAWHHLFRDPVLIAGRKQPGSRVLVTTRKEGVVRRMGASERDQMHVAKLDDEDAWRLLKKQLPPQQPLQVGVDSDFDELKDIGMKIVKICDGLPLAIKVMGGLLSTRRPNEDDWGFVLDKNLEWQKEGSQDELNYSVSLSYDDLSPELKQCFLYYSLFPKGSGFIEERVISMWISEGLVQHDRRLESGQLDLEKLGSEYHRQLVARHLLEPDDSTENIWDYTLHDVVRSFAQFMAREEAFVVHKDQADIRDLLPENQKFRRVSIELTDSELEWTILENQGTLRTLLVDCGIKPGGSLAKFASLRVLDINSEESDWLVDSLCELRHLRYLSFSNTNLSRLPADIHKMRFLQHIQLDNCAKLDKLPNSITKLAHLRYLSIDGSNVDVVPRGFGGLNNLRSLYGFPVKMDGDWCTLEELDTLSHLINLKVQSLENVPDGSVAKRAKIRNKERLEYLELSCFKDEEDEDEDEDEDEKEVEDEDEEEEDEDEAEDGQTEDEKIEEEEEGEDEEEDGQIEDEQIEEEEENEEGKQIVEAGKEVRQIGAEQQERIEEVFDELCPPPTLDTLIISRYFGRRLPNWMHSSAETTFKRLKSIDILHLTYCTQLPDGLCRILGLEELQIDDAPAIEHVGPDFQTTRARGGGGIIVAASFPHLRRLELHGLSGWKVWDWEVEEQSRVIAMPALEYLELTNCKLTHLPPGLACDNRHNLRTISLENMTLLEYVEGFPSVVELRVDNCPELKRISALSMMQTVYIDGCPELKLLEGVPVLESLTLDDEPWKVTGTEATCTPKRYQDGPPRQLPQDLIITRYL